MVLWWSVCTLCSPILPPAWFSPLFLSVFLSGSFSFLLCRMPPSSSSRDCCSLDFPYSYSFGIVFPVTCSAIVHFLHRFNSVIGFFLEWEVKLSYLSLLVSYIITYLSTYNLTHSKLTPDVIIVSIKMFGWFFIIFIYFVCLIGMALGDNMIRVNYYRVE